MDLEMLRTMALLAQTRSFSKTAEVQHLVQSTVSLRIAELEKALGQKLFLRDRQRVTLTEAGLALLPYVRHILADWEDGVAQLASAPLFDDRLVVGTVYSALPNFLLPVCRDYLAAYPRVSVKTITGHSADILQGMLDGLTDLAVTYSLPRSRRFLSYLCKEEDFVLVAAPRDPLAARRGVSVHELGDLHLLFHNWGGAFYAWIRELLPHTRWFHANIGNPAAVLALVTEGVGAAILTRSTAAAALAAGTVAEVPLRGTPKPPVWKTYVSLQSPQLQRPAVRSWFDLMERHGLAPRFCPKD